MTQFLAFVVACGLIVAGVATFDGGAALVVAGLLTAGLAYGFEFEVVDDSEDSL